MKKTIAVFVNYNDGQNIIRSSKDLLSYHDVNAVIIVDNGSTDDSLTKIKQFPNKNLYLIENHKNPGFAKAANKGIKKALKMGADYVAILNPDLVFKKGFITKLIANGADMVQFMLKYKKEGKFIYDFGGRINWWLGKIDHLESDKPASPDPNFVADYVSGGASIIKAEVFKKIGFFDERFFMYFEDADLSLRAKKAGFTIAVEPTVIIEHYLEIVKKTRNWRKIKNNTVANFHFITKDVPWYYKPTAYAYLFLVLGKIVLNFLSAMFPRHKNPRVNRRQNRGKSKPKLQQPSSFFNFVTFNPATGLPQQL